MPRRERPLGGDEGALSQFAGDLRRLREKAGKPTYRELARLAHYSPAALSEAAGGRKLPSLAVTLAYVQACKGDLEEWEARWREIAADERDEMGPGDSPYVGLPAFQAEDADRFFGRERLTEELVEAVRTTRFVGVFGASGSGKSSVLRAGMVPRLGAPALVFTPGPHPVEECAVRLAALTGESAVELKREMDADPANLDLRIRQWNPDLVLVVDQFEEVFTLAAAEERERFIRVVTGGPRAVIGVRADFYGHCGRHPELVDALRGSQLLVGPMTPDELRRAITEPAARAGVKVETALVARLVADVAGQAAALPLVSHALVETWQRRRGMALSLTSYEEAGGLEHAVARTAESVFRSFDDARQKAARLLFLRLIALGEDVEDTKRRVPRGELDVDDELLERLAEARLITLDRDSVELTHEALIRSWPRLRDWIAENRERLRVHRQLVDATAVWEADGRDPDALYRGVRLAQAKLLGDLLGWREREFLTASLALEQEQSAADRRHTHRLRQFVAILAAVVLVLGGTVAYAFVVQRNATNAANNAMSHRGAMEALMALDSKPDFAARTALASYGVARTDAARNAVLSAYAASRKRITGPPTTEHPVMAPGGDLLVAKGGDGVYRLWTMTDDALTERGGLGRSLRDFVFSPDRRYLAAHDDRYAVQVWDVSDPGAPRRIRDLPGPLRVTEVNGNAGLLVGFRMSLSSDGTWTRGFTPELWDVRTGRQLTVPASGASEIAIRPDGRAVAIMRREPDVRIELLRFDGENVDRAAIRAVDDVYGAVFGFSPDGRYLALWCGNRVEMWDVSVLDAPSRLVRAAEEFAGDVFPTAFTFGGDSRSFAVGAGRVVRAFSFESRGELRELGTVTTNLAGVDLLTYQGERGFVAQSTGSMRGLFAFSADFDDVLRRMCEDPFYRPQQSEWSRLFPEVPMRSACR